ncbi:MAG: betaine/proline/choline family ABC transporter ATP-binding protein [Erysipelothrix sp.]|nr:betaine/proline/choline family ABC transporter ATP-binding protein [Erysipelothrix sp.]
MIEFRNISKSYGKTEAVKKVNVTIDSGEFVCFIGTSGSGKTTMMRMINAMIKPTTGAILIDEVDISTIPEVELRRKIGYVIQQIGLMPHMTIYENIVMVPRLLKWSEETMRAVAEDLMQRVDLPLELLDAYPSELSGGMQQRVGVIRALAADQNIILMDEPFGALDPITRDSLQKLIKRLQKDLNKTVVFVTHDMDEALALSDKIVILSHGEIIQQGSPKEILTNPTNDYIKELVGEERLSQAIFEYETVEKIMIDPIKINQNITVQQAAKKMSETRVDDILVVDEQGVLVGRVDLFTLTSRHSPQTIVKDIMKEVTYISDVTSIRDAIYFIKDLGYRNISVVDSEGHLKGLVTRSAIVKTVYDAYWKNYEPQNEEEETVIIDEEKVMAAIEISNGGE